MQSHSLQGVWTLDHVLIFLLNENIYNNSNWMSITVQSISLSVSVSILPRASPTFVSVKLLTPCQLWRRAYLDPGDGWVLVDLSHANIFSESAERGGACACVCVCHSLLAHTCMSIHDYVHRLRQRPLRHLPDTRCLPFRPRWVEHWPHCLKQVLRFRLYFSKFGKLDQCTLHQSVFLWGLEILSLQLTGKTLPVHPEGDMD